MRDCGSRSDLHIEEHIKVHRVFMQDIYSMQAILEEDQASARQLLDFLIHWLAYHILGTTKTWRDKWRIEQGNTPRSLWRRKGIKTQRSTIPLLAALKGLFEQVSERNKQLLRFNQLLEDKVEERTVELNKFSQENRRTGFLHRPIDDLPNCHEAQTRHVHWQDSKELACLACIMIDADHFKRINDNTSGHDGVIWY
ncbi:hypothetical protein O9992_17155 [Vibrio lentus]|nr:hypothetical protein [Vibrio lentus]